MYITYISQVQQLESILCTRDENQSSIQQSVTELGQKLGRAEQENKTLREQLQASSSSEQVNICLLVVTPAVPPVFHRIFFGGVWFYNSPLPFESAFMYSWRHSHVLSSFHSTL